jgi:hypothetical protein
VEVPGWCNDEVRVPLFAQVFGLPIHETRLGNEYFTAGAEMIAPSTVYAQYRKGMRSFHPVRESLQLGEIQRVQRFRYVPNQKARRLMAEQSSPLQFEDVPLDQARMISRGPRMEPMLYDTLRQKIQSLSTEAVRIHLGPEIRPQRMKNYLLSIARELNIPITVRRVPDGVIFWRSSDEDLLQAQETASRLRGRRPQETTQRRPQTRPRGRPPRGTR